MRQDVRHVRKGQNAQDKGNHETILKRSMESG